MKTSAYIAAKLVQAYMKTRVNEAGEFVEILYFVKDHDKVYESVEQPSSPNFSGRVWKESEKSPRWVYTEAEFIGNYHQPSV